MPFVTAGCLSFRKRVSPETLYAYQPRVSRASGSGSGTIKPMLDPNGPQFAANQGCVSDHDAALIQRQEWRVEPTPMLLGLCNLSANSQRSDFIRSCRS